MKYVFKHIIFLLILTTGSAMHAQQLPIFSQYVLNGFILNPAIAGSDGYTSVNTTARQQWVGFGDSPQTISASFQTRMLARSYRIVNHPVRERNMLIPSSKGRVGLGAYIINDVNGHVSRTGVQFSYAYHILLNNRQLSFGLAGKMFQYRIDFEELTFRQKDNEPVLKNPGINNIGYSPDIDVGVYFTDMSYFIGFSTSNLLQSALNFGGIDGYQLKRHYWLMGGYRFDVTRSLSIEPNALIKTTESLVPQADFGVKFYYQEDYWTGIFARTDGTLIALLGYRNDGLFLGYAFDFALSEIQRFNYGSHEISISYKFGDNARRYRWLRRY